MTGRQWQRLPDRAPDDWVCNIVWGGNQLALESFTMPGLDGYLLSVPCADNRAGGDVYQVTVCNHGVFSKFLLVDVAGHGDAAAGFSQRLKQPLSRLMSELDNSAILEHLNHCILENEPMGSFATAAAATYNHWDHSLSYAYAGHPYILIRRNGRWRALPECCAGPPIGVLGDLSYFQNEVPLNGEDWLLMFSDAMLDIKQGDGRRLGFSGLINLLDGIPADSLGGFYQAAVDALVQANGSEHFDDDLTLILLKQQRAAATLTARVLLHGRKLLMRWMKRRIIRCPATLPELTPPANV